MDHAAAARPARSGKHAQSRRREVSADVTQDAWIAAAYLVTAAFLGGSSRFVIVSYVTLQVLSLVAIGYALFRLTPERRALTRPFAWAVLGLAGLMALQLVPLPPALWNALPGHGYYTIALEQVRLADQWRPMSLTPNLTRESLLAVLPALAAAMLFGPLDGAGRRLLFDTLLVCVAICAGIFVVQAGSDSWSFYGGSGSGGGGGPFANRNHLALFLACGLVAIIARWRLANRIDAVPAVLMIVAVVLTFTVLLVNGSRAGLVAGGLAFLVGGAVFGRGALARQTGWRRTVVPVAALTAVLAVFALGMYSTRLLSVDRLLNTGGTLTTTELRTANLPATIEAGRAFFPLGAGFGSFDPVFRRFESDALLRPSYFNHAHNDVIELLIEGGLPALGLLMAAIVWLARCSVVLRTSSSAASVVYAQTGVLGLVLLGLGSLTDYPLRTPFLGVVAILFATWAGAMLSVTRPGVALGTDDGLR